MAYILPDPKGCGQGFLPSTLRHTTPEKFENVALFLWLGIPFTLILHGKGAFRKSSSNWRNLKTPSFRVRVDGKHFENGAFRKRWRHDNHVISLTESSSNTNPKWPVIVAFYNSSSVVWTESICLMSFQSETSVFKFLRRSVDGKHLSDECSDCNLCFQIPPA